MTSSQDPGAERGLLEAVALAAERLAQPSEHPPVAEVLEALGLAADASRAVLVAAHAGSDGSAPRMEVRHQWAAPGVARLQPPNTGWPRYPARWQEELARGTTLAGPARAFPAAERSVLEDVGSRAVLMVPVTVGDEWYGHLALCDTRTERSWSPAEVEALRATSGIIGSAIGHRQALAVLERRTAVLKAMGEATSLLLEAATWRTALPRVLDGLRTATRARSAWAYGPDPGRPGQRVVLLYEVAAPGTRPGVAHARTLDLTPSAAALLAQGYPVHDRLPADEPDPLRAALSVKGVAAWLMVPMVPEPGALGLVGLDSEQPRAWTEGETEALHVLAGALRAAMRRGGTPASVPITPNAWGAQADPSHARVVPRTAAAGTTVNGDAADEDGAWPASVTARLARTPTEGTGNPG